jgi:hypothetical protein
MNIKTNYVRKLRWILIAILCLAIGGIIRSLVTGNDLWFPWLCVVTTTIMALMQQKTIRIQRETIDYYEEEHQ